MFQNFDPDDPLATFTYANNGLVSNRTEGSGASGATYGWDNVNRLTSQSDTFQFNIDNVAWTFGYKQASQITTEIRNHDS